MSIISGIPSLSYTGVEASTPPQFVSNRNRSPTPTDYDNFNIGTLWLNRATLQLYMLVNKDQGVATWLLFGAALGAVTQLTASDANIAFPLAGNINIFQGANILTTAAIANTVTVAVTPTIILPVTVAGNPIPAGAIYLGINAMHTYGTGNLFWGSNNTATLVVVSAVNNTSQGFEALQSLTTGDLNNAQGTFSMRAVTSGRVNTGLGAATLRVLTTGGFNTAIGHNALSELVTGSNCVSIGAESGINYIGNEFNNIIIGTAVTGVAGENNVTRIGGSVNPVFQCFIDGIYGITTASMTTAAVLIDNNGQLGTISSSRRFKENIESMRNDSSPLMNLRPVTFNFISDESKAKQFGLIAEEVYEKMPAIVNLDNEGQPYSVRYHEMPSILLNELQKLCLRVQSLEMELTALKNKEIL